MAFYNELVGGAEGPVYKKISLDMDWGQDLKLLGEYVKENQVDEVVLSYFGTADPGSYGISRRSFTEQEKKKPGKGVYALSVRCLGTVEWAKDHEPTARAGYSILIYDFREGVPSQISGE